MIFDGNERRLRVQNKYLQSQRDEYIYSESITRAAQQGSSLQQVIATYTRLKVFLRFHKINVSVGRNRDPHRVEGNSAATHIDSPMQWHQINSNKPIGRASALLRALSRHSP